MSQSFTDDHRDKREHANLWEILDRYLLPG